MKSIAKALLCFVLTGALCIPLSASGWEDYRKISRDARWTYRTYIDLLYPGLRDQESLSVEGIVTEYVHLDGSPQSLETYRKIEEVSYLTRVAAESVTAKGKNTLMEYVQLEIPRGVTLTIQKGATLTIHGEILVYGKLVNRGTILIDDNADAKNVTRGVPVCGIKNSGIVDNHGTITMNEGMMENAAGGVFHNMGSITVNGGGNWTGLYSRTGDDDKNGGLIQNEGRIHLSGKSAGVYSEDGGLVENEGAITYSTQQSPVGGAVTGNAPQRINQ